MSLKSELSDFSNKRPGLIFLVVNQLITEQRLISRNVQKFRYYFPVSFKMEHSCRTLWLLAIYAETSDSSALNAQLTK